MKTSAMSDFPINSKHDSSKGRLQPEAAVVPVISTGGATLDVAAQAGPLPADLTHDLDYVALFHRHLEISVREERFQNRDEQPAVVERRFWHPGMKL